MGNTFSDPNKSSLRMSINNSKCTLNVPKQMPSKWKPRVDSKMWNDTLQLLQNCELTANRDKMVDQLSHIRTRSYGFGLIVLLGVAICIIGAVTDTVMPTVIFGVLFLIVGGIGSYIWKNKANQIGKQYNQNVLSNMRDTVHNLNNRYNGYVFFASPILKYRKGSEDEQSYYYIEIAVELKADFVDYIDDNAPVALQKFEQLHPNSSRILISNVNDGALVEF
eukprot:UN06817